MDGDRNRDNPSDADTINSIPQYPSLGNRFPVILACPARLHNPYVTF